MQLEIENLLLSFSNKEKAKVLQRFFKTEKGEYGENDIFLGITVPETRSIAKLYYKTMDFNNIYDFFSSKYHEYRLFALFILIEKFQKTQVFEEKKEIIEFYLNNLKYINNWDLVDLSCYKLLGDFLYNYDYLDKHILFKFVIDDNLWIKRISIVSTMYFIRKNEFDLTLQLAKILMFNKEDLLQKATGWLLREVGKKDESLLINFLENNIKNIYNTTFSYATEKLNSEIKQRLKLLR